MMRFSDFCLYTCLTAVSFSAPSAYAATLEEALVSAYNSNPELRSERANLRATDEQISQAISGFLPNASLRYERGKETVQQDSRSKIEGHTVSESLSVKQPVFNGGESVFTYRRAKHTIAAGQASLSRVEQKVLFDSITAYMDLLQNEKVLALSKKNEEVLKKHLEFTRQRFSLGEVTRTDVAQAEARVSRAITERTKAQGEVDIAQATYFKVVGTEPGTLAFPAPVTGLPATLEEAKQLAQQSNPSLQNARFNVLAARDNTKISKAVLLPDVSLNADIRKTDGFAGLGGGEYDTKTATLAVSIPLYQTGSEYSRIRANKEQEEKRRLDAESAYNEITAQAVQAWRALEVAKSNVASTGDAISAAKVALSGVSQEAELGSRTTLDVLDAEQELFVAEVEKVKAQRNEIVTAYQLKAAVGQLTATSLQLPVKHYDPKAHYKKTRLKVIGF